MIRRLWLSMRRDHRINWRNYYLLITALAALIYLGLYTFILPADLTSKPTLFVVDRTEEQAFARLAERGEGEGKAVILTDPAQIPERMKELRNSVGLVLEEAKPLPEVTLYFQGHENAKVRRLLEVSVEAELRSLYGGAEPPAGEVTIATQRLRAEVPAEKPTFRQTLIPLFLFSDAAMIGLLFIAALIFMEKEEGTLQALLVTPGRTWEYLLSKALTLAMLPVLFTLLLVPLSLGGGPNYLHLLLLMALGGIFATLLGGWLSIYFQNLTGFLFPAIALMVAISLPAASYLTPSFAPLWVRALPTYPLVFGLREAAFPTGSPQIVWTAALTLLLVNALLLAVVSVAFRRRLARS